MLYTLAFHFIQNTTDFIYCIIQIILFLFLQHPDKIVIEYENVDKRRCFPEIVQHAKKSSAHFIGILEPNFGRYTISEIESEVKNFKCIYYDPPTGKNRQTNYGRVAVFYNKETIRVVNQFTDFDHDLIIVEFTTEESGPIYRLCLVYIDILKRASSIEF